MELPKIFIASSSEGLAIVEKVSTALQQKLDKKVTILPWTKEFDLSKVFIESLEEAALDIDFALLVMTPDDVIKSRNKKNPVPRDNVIFELGLFMGFLGRDRCFLFHEGRPDLKLPTDLLGIMSAIYKSPKNEESIESVIEKPCSQISERIVQLGSRRKLSPEKLAVQETIYSFSNEIQGAWFERINKPGRNALSFLQIESDPLFNSVNFHGKSYNKEGIHGATWKSTLGRIEIDELKIIYHWEGSKPNSANLKFHGYGEINFEKSQNPLESIKQGFGSFWEVDEYHPEKTRIKPVEFKRIFDENVISTMTSGRKKEVESLVIKTITEW
jgi:hypothetical protein